MGILFGFRIIFLYILTYMCIFCKGKSTSYCKFDLITKTETCNGKHKMDWIPTPSPYATTLNIKYGNFSVLTKDTFLPLKNSSIKSLKLINCGILSIQNGSFNYLKHIEELDLSRNYGGLSVTSVASSLYSLSNSAIKKLSFNWMGWTTLPNEMFNGLINSDISNLSLNHNFFTQINGTLFQNIKSLRFLDISWNGIADNGMNFTGMEQIETLLLSGNWFSYFPSFCDHNNRSLTPNLLKLGLDNTKIFSLYRDIECLDNLTSLNLTGISLRRLYPNTFSKLPSLQTLILIKLGNQLQIINKTAFNSSSLTTLKFSVATGFKFTDSNLKHFSLYIFQYCPNLKSLDLSYNIIQLSDERLQKMFKPLKNLKTLVIKNAKLSTIPENLGSVLPNITTLDLSNNKINNWKNHEPFLKFDSLTTINLKGNRIGIINESSFPDSWMAGNGPLKNLYLGDNPFSCTCDLTWFRSWMDMSDTYNITTDKSNWKCFLTEQSVIDYQPTKTIQCLITYIVTSLVGALSILVTGLIIYGCRWRIRLKIYKWRLNRKSKKYGANNQPEGGYQYDCFVAYSYNDMKWIQEKLINHVEERLQRKLCIHDRDFQIGAAFSNLIIDSIESSRTVLLLISNSFARDKWCEFQMDVTVYLNVLKGRPTLIPILLEDVSFKNMNEMIYKALNSERCLKWTEGEYSEELFWSKLIEFIPYVEEYAKIEYTSNDSSTDMNDVGELEPLIT